MREVEEGMFREEEKNCSPLAAGRSDNAYIHYPISTGLPHLIHCLWLLPLDRK